MRPTDQEAPLDLDARVAVLEERTRQKPKSWRERVNDWGGIASVVIALGYSFPLGVWEKFVEADRQESRQELVRLRTVIDDSIGILSDAGRALSGIQNPQLYDSVGRAFNTRLFVLMTKNAEAFVKRRDDLTGPELVVLGNNFFMIDDHETAKTIFSHVEKHSSNDYQSKVEALRQLAKMAFLGGAAQKADARKLFTQALSTLERSGTLQARVSHATLVSEWGFFEIYAGDWACGQQKIQQSIEALQSLAPVLNDQDNMVKLIRHRLSLQHKQLNQPDLGCEAG